MCFFSGLYNNTIVMHYSSNFKFIIVIIVYFVSVPWIIPVKWYVTVKSVRNINTNLDVSHKKKKTILVWTWHIFLSFIIHQLLAAQWYSNKISQLPSYENEIKSNKFINKFSFISYLRDRVQNKPHYLGICRSILLIVGYRVNKFYCNCFLYLPFFVKVFTA